MVNETLKAACKNFIVGSINILKNKVEQGMVIPTWTPFVRKFDEKGNMTATAEGPPLYEFGEFIFSFRSELYSSKEIDYLVDLLLKDDLTRTSLAPVSFTDKKQEEGVRYMVKYNYLGAFLTEYIDRVEAIKFDESEFNNIYEEFENSFKSDKGKYISLTPLKNFECEVPEIDLGAGLKIREITKKEFNVLQHLALGRVNSFSFGSLSMHDILAIKYVIAVEFEAIRNNYGGEGKNIQMVISALHINKSGPLRHDITLSRPISWQPYAGMVILGRPETTMPYGSKYTLNSQETATFKEFWANFKNFNFEEHKILDIAIKRLNDTYGRPKSEDKIIDSFVGLEAMFLTGSERSELSYRLSVRIAKFLGTSQEEKNMIFSEIRKAYGIRSRIVHGDSVKQQDISEIAPKTEEYTRLSLKKFLYLLSNQSYTSLIQEIDTNIFT